MVLDNKLSEQIKQLSAFKLTYWDYYYFNLETEQWKKKSFDCVNAI